MTLNYKISLTENGLKQIKKIRQVKNNNHCLKIEIKSGGCKEYQYKLSMVDINVYCESDSKLLFMNNHSIVQDILNNFNNTKSIEVDRLQDSNKDQTYNIINKFIEQYRINLFSIINNDSQDMKYCIFQENGDNVLIIDELSLGFMQKGCDIDYENTLVSCGFIIKNKASTSSCGCGNSFQFK